ncbi:MAG: antibiotic biosynthesis monooxygenase [Burkholderiales bacterium]|nr:antibiotic biosynthesis monooxygenase [Burkholderiales bacterium]
MAGVVSVERFQGLSEPNKFLSLSFWRDESAVLAWRNLQQHREAQARGCASIFAHYRLRVAQAMRDYGLQERELLNIVLNPPAQNPTFTR